ncbi:ABC transporter permease [bacterium]|nr:ABC transporter permease [bacterium]
MNDISQVITQDTKRIKKLKKTKSFAIPYLVWMGIFLVVPMLILIFLAFTTYDFSQNSEVHFTLSNWAYVFNSRYAVTVFWPSVFRSFYVSFIVTLICLVIGYPVAYLMSKLKAKYRALIMIFLSLPLWCNQVLRIISWRTIFEILGLNYNEFYIFNIIVAMVSMYLPFMILPIYTVLEKLDKRVIEASYDLGCSKIQSFFKVTLPLSLGGIVSGVIMTFLPSLTSFEVSDAVSYNTVLLLGNLIHARFHGTGGYNIGSVFSIITIVFTVVGFILVLKVDKEGETLI